MNILKSLVNAAARPLLLAALMVLPALGHAEPDANWPSRPIRFVVPYPPGGLADTFARVLAEGLSERLKQSVVIDNKPGGSLIIGTEAAAKAPPDGYTILLGSASSLAINVSAFRKLPYDPVKDFAPVSLGFRTPLILMVAPTVPATNVKELIAYCKAHPGQVSFASLGYGSTLHLSGELFKTLAGVDIVHVPYKGTTSAVPDLLTGRVSMMFDGGALLPHAREGKVKMLGVTGSTRPPNLPDVPTLAEAGVPGYALDLWFGVVAPAGTPTPIVERLAREIKEVEQRPDFRAKLAGYPQVQFETTTPAAMGTIIRKDIVFWGKLLREYQVEPQ